jgi:SAM-dependent methyltransferase
MGDSTPMEDYDWYPTFRAWMQGSVSATSRSPDAVAQRYADSLKGEGIAPGEIERRLTLLRTNGRDLETYFWNRFFTADTPNVNTEPNAFLVSIVEGRKPGKALDVGIGDGRNALYLARLGWDVTGFDPADRAVALAQSRAESLALELRTAVALDTTFDYGRAQWDLILYCWGNPTESASKVPDALRHGGLVVVEGAREWFAPDALTLFAGLRVVHHEELTASPDFFNRGERPILRLVAEKPFP